MSIDYTVDEEKFTSLDEGVQGLYEKNDTGYQLKVEGLPPQEDVSGLKRKVDELLNEKKNAQQKAIEAERQAQAEKEEKLAKEGKWEALYNSSEEARRKSDQSLSDLNLKIERQQINNNALEVASNLTKDTARAKLLSEKLAERLSIVDGDVRVTDQNGNPTVSTLEELTLQIKNEYPFLVDGSQASGGGATGNSGGAGDSKTLTRADFESLPAFKRMEFIKSGGQIDA
jgi:hypothetical protein